MAKAKVLAITTDKDFLSSLNIASGKLELRAYIYPTVPPNELLEKPWHAVIVDAETVGIDSIYTLSLLKSLSPLSLRCLIMPSLDPHLLLRAINEAQVHHVWLKPVSHQDLENSLRQRDEMVGGQTFPFIFSASIESKLGGNYGHSYRVAQYALAIGRQLNLSEIDLKFLQIGCLLHDIGKLLLPEKAYKIDEAMNRAFLQQHPLFGEQIAKNLGLPKEVIGIIRHHHERWDGQGYPERLKGEAIPLLARIAALANAYDHLTDKREDEMPLNHSEINQLLRSEAGFAFDPVTVKALLSLREPQDVTEVLGRITQLPTLAPIVQRALVLLERDDFDWKEVADVIVQDQNLVAQILKLANSAMTGLRRKVTSLSTALKILGARSIKNLLLILSVRPFFQELSYLQLWEHSLTCALIARDLAKRTQFVDPEEAFTAGLLHDIGKVVLSRYFPKSYKKALQIAHSQKCPIFIVERLIFSTTHAEVGALLLEHWRIPIPFCKAVAMHHIPVAETYPLAWHLYWANQLIHIALDDYPPNRWLSTGLAPESLHAFIVHPEQLVKKAIEQSRSIEAILS